MTVWSEIKAVFRGASVDMRYQLSLRQSGRKGADQAQKPGEQGVFARDEVGLRQFHPKHGL